MKAHAWLQLWIEKGKTDPAEILNHQNNYIYHNLTTQSEKTIKDTMDMAICSYDNKTWELKIAGSKSDILIISDIEINDIEELIKRWDKSILKDVSKDNNKIWYQIRTDRFWIWENANQKFNEKILHIDNAKLYLYSDWFQDQFWINKEWKEKKFMKKHFRKLIIDTSNTDLSSQKRKILSTLKERQNDLEQVDDITVIWIKLEKKK